jgi:hypothetical protein
LQEIERLSRHTVSQTLIHCYTIAFCVVRDPILVRADAESVPVPLRAPSTRTHDASIIHGGEALTELMLFDFLGAMAEATFWANHAIWNESVFFESGDSDNVRSSHDEATYYPGRFVAFVKEAVTTTAGQATERIRTLAVGERILVTATRAPPSAIQRISVRLKDLKVRIFRGMCVEVFRMWLFKYSRHFLTFTVYLFHSERHRRCFDSLWSALGAQNK